MTKDTKCNANNQRSDPFGRAHQRHVRTSFFVRQAQIKNVASSAREDQMPEQETCSLLSPPHPFILQPLENTVASG